MMPGAGGDGRKKETMGDENTTAWRCGDCGLSFAAVPAWLHFAPACVRRLKEQRAALVNRLAEECMEHRTTRKKLTLALVEVDTAHARQAEAERRLAALAGAKV